MSDAADPLAFLVMHQGDDPRRVPIHDYVVVGRECAGIDPRNRLVVIDDYISRRHFEIRLDLEHDQAWLVDTSTNGTRINGRRVDPATATALGAGDRITVGDVEFEFRADAFRGRGRPGSRSTQRPIAKGPMALVVGDIVSYSTIAEYTEDEVLFGALDHLYGTLRIVLEQYHGTVNSYPGDAMFAAWEVENVAETTSQALQFALAAAARVRKAAPELVLRDPGGVPVRMGWAVVIGDVAVSALIPGRVTVLGDAANLAFRIAGLAGREGRADVLVTDEVRAVLGSRFVFENPESVRVKGRQALVTLFSASSSS